MEKEMDKKICTSLILKKDIENNGQFTGYASVFDVIDSHNDVVLKGAFTSSINKNNIKLLWQHNCENPIGKVLKLREDSIGLQITGKLLLSIQKGNEAYQMLKSGIINALSIGYRPIDYEIEAKTGTRILKIIDLWEISLVTFPSNSQAKIMDIKSNIAEKKILRSLIRAENILKSLY